MKDYQYFEFEDFLEDVAFRRWVYHPRPQDEQFWKQWLAEHPEKTLLVVLARQQLLAVRGDLSPLPETYIDQKVAQLVRQAQVAQPLPERPVPFFRRTRSLWYALAASVVLWLGVLGISHYPTEPASGGYARLLKEAGQPLAEVENTGRTPKRVRLADGSVAILYQNSRLSFPRQFTGNVREVYLTGLAFFEVTKDPSRPFLVYANELVTKVLGTSFFVRAYEQDQQVQVTVRTGKVSVFARTDRKASARRHSRELGGMILTPNQQGTLVRSEKRFVRSLVAEPLRVDAQPATEAFVFRQTPIADVFEALERAYGVDIVFDETLLARCTVTARLDNESLYKKLEWICTATESSFEEVDGQIIISGKGCH